MAHPAFPPHHIKSVSINDDGWVIPSSKGDDSNPDEIAITQCCRLLLKELKLDLSHDVFRTTPSATDGGENICLVYF
jgi:hypothetical protein